MNNYKSKIEKIQEDLSKKETEIDSLKKKIKEMDIRQKTDNSNLRANYISVLFVSFFYLFFKDLGDFIVADFVVTPIMATTVLSVITFLFFYRDILLYSKFLTMKIVNKS